MEAVVATQKSDKFVPACIKYLCKVSGASLIPVKALNSEASSELVMQLY